MCTSNENLTQKLRRENKASIVKEFQIYVERAFVNAAVCMQENLTLTNKFLICLPSLDSTTIEYSTIYSCLKTSVDFCPVIFTNLEKTNIYLKETSSLQLDGNLPSALDENDVSLQLDLWWAKNFETSNYTV